jgi:hypothetical protein
MAKRAAYRKALASYRRVKATSRPGEGRRFAALTKALAARGARNPRALAAWIGRQKYGRRRFAQMAAAGRRRAKRR